MTDATVSPMPAAFFGHGSPMNALEDNRYTAAWRAFGAALPKPRAVLVVSAHWYIEATAVTAMARPRTIHDFFGFPEALFAVDYPAPGSPEIAREIAREIADAAQPGSVMLDSESWGLDHGTWSVLKHVFPRADVPVLQLSIHAGRDLAYHVALGARLAPLRERGVLIVASGDVVHNLRRVDFRRPEAAFDWAERFDAAAREVMTTRPAEIARLASHPDYDLAVPTPEHFLPLAYLAGLAQAAGHPASELIGGCALGSLSMTCYTLDSRARAAGANGAAAAGLPDPREVSAWETNA